MIGKIKRGKSFAGVCNYLLNTDKREPGRVIGGNMAGSTAAALTREFDTIASLSSRVKVPVKHFSVSFANADGGVDDDRKNLIAIEYMERMGYSDSQYVVVSHSRTDHNHNHDHIHIVANAVALDGSWVNDRLDWKKSQTILRDLEREYDLTPVLSSWDKTRDRAQSTRVDRRVERLLASGVELSEIDLTRTDIQSKVNLVAPGAASMTEFCERLQNLGIEPIAKITRTGKVQGISYKLGELVVRGSDLENGSFPALQRHHGISYDPARDLPNLKSILKGSSAQRRQTEALTPPLQVTPPEIPKTELVTRRPKLTPLDLTKTEWYLDFDELMRDPEPQIERWRPTLQQPTDRELLDRLEPLWEKYGTEQRPPQFGNYRIEFGNEIDIYYRDLLAMRIDERGSHLIDDKYTLAQYERGLSNAIAKYHEELEIDRAIDLCEPDLERDRERELEPEIAQKQYPDLTFYPDLDFSTPDSPERQRERERYRDLDRGR
jgi:hypothetical protein